MGSQRAFIALQAGTLSMGLSSSSEAQRIQAEVDKYKPRQSELINSKTAGLVLQKGSLNTELIKEEPGAAPEEDTRQYVFKAHLSSCGVAGVPTADEKKRRVQQVRHCGPTLLST